jgi:hypothetical protein
MSEKLAKWAEAGKKARRSDLPKGDGLKPMERKALWKLRAEAKEAGSELTSGGKGGLPPSLVLGAMRRDKFTCKACGELGSMEENGGLGVHHRSEHLESPKAKARSRLLGKEKRIDSLANIVSLCQRCHDHVHEEDRAEFGDAEQRANPERH